jgi:hypothetical protein
MYEDDVDTIVRYASLKTLLDRYDVRHAQVPPNSNGVAELAGALGSYFEGKVVTRAVLGIDIYQYGRMPPQIQNVIPGLFQNIYEEALHLAYAVEPAIFPHGDERQDFISTGDGGFQIFATPLQAVVFAVFFEWFLSAFNSYHYLPRLRQAFGRPVIVRYALTYDLLFRQDNNVFGAAMINNARIMARDTLNRFLLDENAVDWFRAKMISIESLATLRWEELVRFTPSKKRHVLSVTSSQLFGSRDQSQRIKSVHLQKIGVVTSKESKLEIYSLMLQVEVSNSAEREPAGTAIVTVGNLNPSGLVERAG